MPPVKPSFVKRCLDQIRKPVPLSSAQLLDETASVQIAHMQTPDGCLLLADPARLIHEDGRFADWDDFETALQRVDELYRTRGSALIKGSDNTDNIGVVVKTQLSHCTLYKKRLTSAGQPTRRYGARLGDVQDSHQAVRKLLGRFPAGSGLIVVGAPQQLLPGAAASQHFPTRFDLEVTASEQHLYQFMPSVGLLISVPENRTIEVIGLFTHRQGLIEVYVDI